MRQAGEIVTFFVLPDAIGEIVMQEKCEIFAEDGLSNIFEGALVPVERQQPERISPYRIIGYRLENKNQKEAHVICRGAVDSKGIYTATLHFKGVRRKARNTHSSFFPKDWSKEKVINKICEARRKENFLCISQDLYIGQTSDGMKIGLRLDENDKIYDAMPVSNELKNRLKGKPKAHCKKCGEPKHTVCLTHHNFPTPTIKTILRARIQKLWRRFYFGTKRKLKLVD